jgi:hypothetical protein
MAPDGAFLRSQIRLGEAEKDWEKAQAEVTAQAGESYWDQETDQAPAGPLGHYSETC